MTRIESAGPLAGIKVVELGVWVAGPAAGGVLADWGADVVKIEPPEGDPARGFAKMLGGDVPFNPPFEMDNRSKRSIVIDLGDDAGREIARELLAGADVFITNIRMDALRPFIQLGADFVVGVAQHVLAAAGKQDPAGRALHERFAGVGKF